MNSSGFTIIFGGPDFQPGEFLRDSRLAASIVHCGDALRRGGVAEESWLEFAHVHDGTYPLDAATEALDFLRSHHDEFARLARFPGVVTRALHLFGDAASCTLELEPADVALLHGLSVHVSICPYASASGNAVATAAPPTLPKTMNRFRFSTIAHGDHLFCSPLSSARADELVDLLDLPASARLLDIGCGKAELLLRVVQRYDASAGVGVDLNGECLREARARAQARGLEDRMEWLEARAADLALEPASFDLALCVGSSQAFGTFPQALAALAALVRPGGQVLIADSYWRCEPAPEYLAFLGASAADFLTHAGNEAAGLAMGLAPLYSCVSHADEWDHYEGLYCRAVERFVRDHPEDPDAPTYRERIRAWRECYRRWSRDTLGFGFYLFGKP